MKLKPTLPLKMFTTARHRTLLAEKYSYRCLCLSLQEFSRIFQELYWAGVRETKRTPLYLF